MGLVQGVWQRGEVSATLKGWLWPLRDGQGVGAGDTQHNLGGSHHARFSATTCAGARARSWGTGGPAGPPSGGAQRHSPSLPGLAPCSLRVLGSGFFSSSRRWCHNGVRRL